MNNQPVRMALPVPDAGTALGGAGESYVASLSIHVESRQADDARVSIGTSGNILELLLMAMRMRHIGFNPRTFAFVPFEIPGDKLAKKIEDNWSSIDSSGSQVVDLADALVMLAKRSSLVTFSQSN